MPGRHRVPARGTVALLAVAAALTLVAVPVGSAAFGSAHRTMGRVMPIPAASGPFRVVGLGDSVPAGTACGCTSYIALVGQQVAVRAGRSAVVSNLAQPGLTTAGLTTQLQDSAVRGKLAVADLIIVTIGANDFDQRLLTESDCRPVTGLSCYQDAIGTQRTLLSAVLAQIAALRASSTVTVLVTGYWNVFLDGQVGAAQGSDYVAGSNALTLAENALIASLATGYGDTYVDLYTPFKGDGTRDDTDLLAADGDHPNAAGHALIARVLLDAVSH